MSPSPIAFKQDFKVPFEMDDAAIRTMLRHFAVAAHRSREAGMDVLNIHAAYGCLIHSFLSPLPNRRTDHYGSSFEN